MKKKLLYLTSVVLFSATSINAQIKVWNFATDNLPGYNNVIDTNAKVDAVLYSGTGANLNTSGVKVEDIAGPPKISGNLIGSFGANTDKVFYVNDGGGDRLRLENTAITAYNNENSGVFDSFFGVDAPWGRFYLNGAGSNTRRYFGFNLAVGESITMYYYTDTTNPADKLTVESPSGTLTTITVAGRVGSVLNLTATEAGLYKVYSALKLCVGRIYEGNVTLAAKDFQKESDVVVYANDGKIFLSNIKSSTNVEVYSVLGALVKSAKAEADTSLDINAGVYIVKAKSAEGEKSVKVIVK